MRAWGLALAGRLAERLGRRDEALGWYQQARAHLAERPEFATYFEDLREEIEADLAAARPGAPLPETPSLLAAPR